MNLADKRIQVMAAIVVGVFGFIGTFLTVAISFGLGFERTFTWAVIVGLLGWIIAERVIQRTTPKTTEPLQRQSGAGGYSCLGCGTMEVLAPPDSEHIFAKLEPCTQGDSIAMNWRCRRCSRKNVTHWDRYHPPYASVNIPR
jgi:hypothetical protein